MAQATEGQLRVVYTFNPDAHPDVAYLKERCASVIDDILAIGARPTSDSHAKRWAAMAATDIETACMYAVKAVTHEACADRQ